MGVSVVCVGHTPESFLSGSVPNLKFYLRIIHTNDLILERNATLIYDKLINNK